MTKDSNNYKIGRIPTTSHGVRNRPKGGNALAFGFIHKIVAYMERRVLQFSEYISYENDKCISQHSRMNVPKGGMMLYPMFSYVEVRHK